MSNIFMSNDIFIKRFLEKDYLFVKKNLKQQDCDDRRYFFIDILTYIDTL